ncbi:hypothetical protein V2I01_17075 [Micromonospora sp. BRA006-A]|nr:hypothetical protein [Micromonospora sp. BRA006-A]
MRSWIDAIDRPEIVDDALRRDDPYAGVALLTLVLNHPEPDVVLPRIKRALTSVSAQTRANALQSSATTPVCTAGSMRTRSLTCAGPGGPYGPARVRDTRIRGDAASDVAIFAPRRRLPRWLRRRFAGPAPRS